MKWLAKKQEPVKTGLLDRIAAEPIPLNIVRASKAATLHLAFNENPNGQTRCQKELKSWELVAHFPDRNVLEDLFYGEPRKRWFAENFPDYSPCPRCFFLG